MSVKHLAKGSKCPPLAPGVLRIYIMKYCPFAQRARLVLAHKNIPHETVLVAMGTSKPDWYWDKNPAGTVPTLEQDNKLVQDSGICMDYLDDISPGKSLYPTHPYLKARMRLDMEMAGKRIVPWYKFLKSSEQEREKTYTDLMNQLADLEELVKGKFMTGDEPMMIDFYTYPIVERFSATKELLGREVLRVDKLPKLSAWYSNMVALPAVQASFSTPETHLTFFKMYVGSGDVDYDFEL